MKTKNNCHRKRFNWVKWFRREFVVMITLYFFCANIAIANPLGGQVVSGNVQFNIQGNTLNIINSPNSIINWQSFSINSNETTRFIQQNSASSVLNRIYGQNPSVILGLLQSNGRVLLINSNGIIFGPGSRVDVNGFIASTLNLSNQDFLSGKYNFTAGLNPGSIQNQGAITTPSGSMVYLIAPDIENSGIINSPRGDVLLAAGHSVGLVDSLNPEIAVVVSAPADRALNLGQIIARSGTVGIYGGLILQKGIINADSAVVGENGKIFFKAAKDITLDAGSTTSAQGGNIRIFGGMEDGTVKVAGTIDASAPHGGDGGFIETSAAHVKIEDSARVTTLAPYGKTGTWLIDPVDFTIATSGGDMTGSTLSSTLTSGDVTINSSDGGSGVNGDIFVNDTLSWSANKLTLNAYRNIEINQTLNGSGTAQLALFYGQAAVNAGNTATYSIHAPVNLPAGSNFITKLGNDVTEIFYTVITDIGLPGSTTGTDLQGINGNLSGYYVLGSNIDAGSTSTWNGTLGFAPVGKSPAFTGIFDGLGHTITGLFINRPATDYVGLFGYANNSTIRNVGLVNVNITGRSYVGGLVGYNYGGSISNSYSMGSVLGSTNVGGLAGYNSTGAISNSYSTGTVSNSSGYYSIVGGLVGYNYGGSISNAYSTGAVTGTDHYVGGLVGVNEGGSISNAYSTGAVTGNTYVGGLVGYMPPGGSISNSYSTGAVTGNTNVGGLIGSNGGSISNSFWDTQTSGKTSSAGGTGLTTTQMIAQSSFTGFDFGTIWWMSDGNTRPFLRSEYSTQIINAHELQLMAMNLGASYTLAANIDMGELTQPSGLWNTSTGFVPIGNNSTPFTGIFNGLGYTITGLKINLPASGFVGLFGNTGDSAIVKNVVLDNTDITGQYYVGGLVGWHEGSIINVSSTGTVNGSGSCIGGLVGQNNGSIKNTYSTASVNGNNYTGGLVGQNVGKTSDSYSTGAVTGTGNFVGGLVGENAGGIITDAYSAGAVTDISGNRVGGLVGNNYGPISNSYSTDAVNGLDMVGGLVGDNTVGGSITNSYSTGAVTGSSNWGGLVGSNSGTVTNSYWDTITSGQSTSAGGTGLTTTQMMTSSFYDDKAWDFTNIWWMSDGNTRPFLRSEYSTTISNAHQLQLMALDLGASYALGGNIDMGELTQASGLWNTSTGFIPIGNDTTSFTGTFNGQGHTITGLFIYRPSTDYIGLFGYTGSSAIVQNVGLVNADITGQDNVGALVGWNDGNITNSYSTGAVTGTGTYWGVGGLVGENNGSITNSYSTATVTGNGWDFGGLAGENDGTIANSHSTGAVTGNGDDVGGLVGYNAGGIDNSYSTGSVSGNYYIGGLVGANGGTISNSHYDIVNVLINGGHYVTEGGLYPDLYSQWLPTKTLNISDHLGSPDGDGYYLIGTIQNLKDLLGFIDNASYKFKLTADMDLTALPDWHLPVFAGVEFNGAGHTLSNLSVNQPFNDDIGFIGWLKSGSTLTNLKLANVNVTGDDFVGGMAGENEGTLNNSSSQGTVTGTSTYYGTGGLVGYNNGTINNSSSTGSVSGNDYVGGLVGYNDFGSTITNSYSTGSVNGNDSVGGLVGENSHSIVSNSYSTGNVTGTDGVGGLLGVNTDRGNISNSYSTGDVTGTDGVGGLVGLNSHSLISNSYSTGSVTGSSNTGGLVGSNTTAGTITNSYWDTEASGQSDLLDDRGTGKTTTEMMAISTFTGWDITNASGSSAVWRIYDGQTYPLLRSFLTPAIVTANDASKTYDESAYSGGNGVTCSTGSCDSKYMGELTYGGTSQGAINAGGYTITPSGFYSNQQGYDISFANGTLTISPVILTTLITGSLTGSVIKVYDGTNVATLNPSNYLLTGWLGSDGATVTKATGTYNNANAGSNKTVTVTLATSDYFPTGSTNLANYTLPTLVTGSVGIINPAALSITANAYSKTYNGLAYNGGNGVSYSGFVNGETSSVLGGTLAYGGNSQGAINAGSYVITPGGLTSGNYIISYYNGVMTIDKYPITLTAQTNTKIYDGNTSAETIPVITSGNPQGTDTANFIETYDTKDTGTGKTLTASGVMNDGNSGNNYSYTFITDTTGVINPATNQETSSLPEQNILYVTKPDANGTTMTIVSDTTTASDGSDSKTGSGSEGYSDSNKDKEKNKDENKKDGSQTQKEGQKSGIKKQALPYCN